MDDNKPDTENEYPHRESSVVEGHTRYPVREARRPLRFSSEHRFEQAEPSAHEENDFTAYKQRTAARRAEHLQDVAPKEEAYQEEVFRKRESARREERFTREPAERPIGNRSRYSAKKQDKRRKKRHFTGFSKALLVVVIALLVGIFSFFFMRNLMNPPSEEVNLSGQTVSITIPEGAGTNDIAQILKENKLIGSVLGFKLTSKLEGFDGTYKHGTYDVDTGLTKRQIMELLQSGKIANNLKITIPEGYTVKQIAAKVAETELCTADEFMQECNTGSFDYAFLKDLPDREYKLEGYLFPDTYFLHEGMTAHDIIDAMLARFDQMYTKEYQQAVADSGYTLDEIVTVASMIEKEIKVETERPTAAGVIYNRLKADMTLGIDATVLYAVGKTSGELTTAELETDSPYNTRKNKGLPLGPIANPGESSFKAALYPEDNNYLYYVVEAVGKDNHVYCETYDEFLAAKRAYTASAQ